MGERVTRVTATAFRGVRDTLTIDLPEGRSLVVFGDNGTGKSTIADALEWYFKGCIDLLRHEGRQKAIRHLAARADMTTAVEVETTGVLGGGIAHPGGVPPDVVTDVANRETFLLRGRTLAEFVDKPKGEKWKALTQILGLEAVDQLRLDLQRARNDLVRDRESALTTLNVRASALSSRVGRVDEAGVLDAIHNKCAEAGVVPPATLDIALDQTWAQSVISADASITRALRLRALASDIHEASGLTIDWDVVGAWNAHVAAMPPEDRRRLALFQATDAYLRGPAGGAGCPVCGQAIAPDILAERVERALLELKEASERVDSTGAALRRIVHTLTTIYQRMGDLRARAAQLGVELPVAPPAADESVQRAMRLRTVVDIGHLQGHIREAEAWLASAAQRVEGIAPPSATDSHAPLIEIGALAADARNWRAAWRAHAATARAAVLADSIFSAYQKLQRQHVEDLLHRISERAAEIYERLHPGEGLAGICVEPWTDKGVELVVDFYGARQKPPHGVLSESHLNSLAIALFLAMAQTFNQHLRFLVLDDVVNSFDIDHRGNLARLLADEFGDWQLIVLTHDAQFYEHIWRRGQGWGRMEFTSWTFEDGPRTATYAKGGILEKAEECLPDDVTGAAQKARRALEELLQEICERLEAPLPFRRGARNDRREAGELFVGLRRRLKEVSKPLLQEQHRLLTDLEADLAATLNVEAHASRGRASVMEVQAALDRIKKLDRRWTCSKCHTRIWHAGTPDASRCRCGSSRFPP